MRAVEVRTGWLNGAAAALRAAADQVSAGTGPAVPPPSSGDARLDDLLHDLADILPRSADGLGRELRRASVLVRLGASGYERVESAALR